ncbi:MAG: hypothetical protein RBS57_18640 [Desulforhabdus sp.]|jgi:hypothetical protein|nr:hypothetical protein [Desulforhabdus sp.]
MLKLVLRILLVALVALTLAAPVAFAEPIQGEVVVIEGGTYTVKDRDGKEYQITQELVTGLDLETGDIVQFELEEAKPVNIKEIPK